MAQIRVDLREPMLDGMDIKFLAPCDCSAITGLLVCYPTEDSTATKAFSFRDSHGNDLTGLGNLFLQGSIVKVTVDVGNGYAYLQNAATNGYIESKIGAMPKFYFGDTEPDDWSDGDIWLKPVEV